MDSSRSGLLSTLLMTLPLIVVPAVALLRPPGQAGVATVELEASEGMDGDSMFEDFPEFESDPAGATRADHPTDADERPSGQDDSGPKPEDHILQELNPSDAGASENVPPRTSPPGGANKDPFLPEDTSQASLQMQRGGPAAEQSTGSDQGTVQPDAGQIIEQLNSMGALKTLWFEAGDQTPVGLAVFFRGSKELTRFRFEAVGDSREACARDVLEQVTRWQQQNSSP